jgi:hypothetical protein
MDGRGRAAARLVAAALLGTICFGVVPRAVARRGVRPLFEPTDLELEDAGILEIDVQLGAVRSPGPWRLVMPDFELDLGILPNLELDLDGAYAIEGPQTGPFSLDHAAPDSLWPSLKWGVFDWTDDDARSSWAIGVQAGPKVPVQRAQRGIGAEALLLVGHAFTRTHLVLNAGAFIDPAPDASSGRPGGVEVGLDLQRDLGTGGRFSLQGELSGVWFWSGDPRQLLATAGATWSVTPTLDLSVIALAGFLAGSDRYGLLLGVSPKFRLFH